MRLFDAAKTVPTLQVAEHYGIHVDQHGRAKCLFHSDNNPSMKIYEGTRGFYCFACQASGTAIDMVMKLFGVKANTAAMMICRDFGIPYDNGSAADTEIPRERVKSASEIYEERLQHYTEVATDYLLMLERWLRYSPKSAEEEPNELFLRAIREHDRVEWIVNTLLSGDEMERAEIVILGWKELEGFEQVL